MLYAIVAALVLILDQAVKLWTTKNIVPLATGGECVELIPGVLHMTNVQNTGAAFSILANASSSSSAPTSSPPSSAAGRQCW